MNKTTRLLLWLAGWVFLLLIIAIGLTSLAVRKSRQQFENYQAELEKRGERFVVADLAPAPPPLEGNGARELTALARELGDTAAADGIRIFQTSKEESPGKNIVIHRAGHALILNKEVPWEEVQGKFAPLTPPLARIREISKSPVLELQLDFSQGFAMPLSGVTESLKAGQHFSQEGILFLQKKMTSEAVGNVRPILRLAEMTEKQPLLISQLVSASLLGIAQNLTWEILQSNRATEVELAGLQQDWERVRIARFIVPVWRMERAVALPFFETPSFQIFSGVSTLSSSPPKPLTWLPKSWDETMNLAMFLTWGTLYRYADARQFLENYQTLIDLAPKDPVQGPWSPALHGSVELQNSLGTAGIERLFSGMLIPSLESSFTRIVSTQAMANLTTTALALQRHQLAHGEYPSSLDQLTPAFLAAIPRDPFDGEPLRYRKLDSQSFLLYAVGIDGGDDHGDVTTRPDISRRRSFMDGKDMVWPQAAP